MTASSGVLRQLVDFALPKPCKFSEENFAGDPLVRDFCNRLSALTALDLHFFVAWACPPDVAVIRAPTGNAIVRSERLDTLLVEYYRLQSLHRLLAEDLLRDVTASAVLRWMCELLIGYRQPGLSLFAQRMRPKLPGLRLTNPFRDETLASIPELERVAIQCICLAHEVGHLKNPRRPDATLDHPFDGLPLSAHLVWGDRQTGHPEDVLEAFSQLWRQQIDGPTLVNEVKADLFAFSSVLDFLCNHLAYALEDAIRATLRAFEAQLFVCACKNTCRLLSRSIVHRTAKPEFLVADYLIGAEYLARARAIARRAGIVWAIAEQPEAAPGTRDYNSYVQRIDSMIIAVQPFTALAAETLSGRAQDLFDKITQFHEGEANAFSDQLKHLKGDGDMRMDLWEMLIAFGCPGGVDVVEYLESMHESTHRA